AAATVGALAAGPAWSALTATLGGIVLAAWLADRTGLLQRAVLPKTPDVMAERARELLSRLAPDGRAVDEAYSFEWDAAYLRHLTAGDRSAGRWLSAAEPPFAPFYFYFLHT